MEEAVTQQTDSSDTGRDCVATHEDNFLCVLLGHMPVVLSHPELCVQSNKDMFTKTSRQLANTEMLWTHHDYCDTGSCDADEW